MKLYGLGLVFVLLFAAAAQAGHPWPGCKTCGLEQDACAAPAAAPHVFGCDREPPPSTWDGSYWGFGCPRSRNLHLWDDYCLKTSPCPCCGHNQGGLYCKAVCRKRCLRSGACNGLSEAGPTEAEVPSAYDSDGPSLSPPENEPASDQYNEAEPIAKPAKYRKK